MSKRIAFIAGFLLLIFALWLQTTTMPSVSHFIDRLQDLGYDIQLRAKLFTQENQKQTSIAIIDIDDRSLSAEGRWPWSREKIANLVRYLKEHGAVVIAFDVIFPEAQTNIITDVSTKLVQEKLMIPSFDAALKKITPFFDRDDQFAKSLAQTDSVLGISFTPRDQAVGVLGAPLMVLKTPQEKKLGFIDANGVIGNIPILQAAAKGAGFVNVMPDEDGVIRRVPILIRYQDRLYPSLALEAVRLFWLSNIRIITAQYNDEIRVESVQLGDSNIPTDEKAQVLIPFYGKSFTFPYFSATDVLHNKVAHNAFEGKIIFIGTSATGLGDLKATAIQSIYPGVEIQASIAQGVINKHFSRKPAWALGAEVFLTVCCGLIFIFLFPYLGPRVLTLLILCLPVFFIFLNVLIWRKTGLIISIFIPISFSIILAVLNIVFGYLFETRKREHLKEMFGQYVPAKHIDEMLTATGGYALYGEDREMTVLFADIRNFTTISEPLSAKQLKEMLNEFFTPMTEIIFKYNGTIDKYVGDMIMAFWGAPLKDKRHQQHAINAALEMQNAVEKLKPIFKEKNWDEVNIGIGLNTGEMSVGDMGSKFRRNYTVLGDAVNLGSRIESLTKYYGVKIMVAENTQANQTLFIFRKVDRVRVKGKKKGIELYEVLGRIKALTPELKQELDRYHAALENYFNRQFEKARAVFKELNAERPEVKLYSLYLERSEEFIKTPPGDDWDGIYTHAAK